MDIESVPGFTVRESGGVVVLVPDFFGRLGLSGGFSARRTKSGRSLDLDLRGDKDTSAILENRRLVAEALHIEPRDLVIAEQVHGDVLAAVADADRGRGAITPVDTIPGVDGLITTSREVSLGALAADCAVVLIAAENTPAVALVHSGRKGTLANIASRAVDRLNAVGAPPQSLYAAIGPAIGGCCYEVGDDIAHDYESTFAWAGEVLKIVSGRAHLDIPAAIRRQLAIAGVRPEMIFGAGLCTVCKNDLFFSYRREGAAAGRNAGIISINR